MFTHSTNIQRINLPGIIPLELWDMVMDGRILWDMMDDGDFAKTLLNSLHKIKQGNARSRSNGAAPDVVRNIDTIVIGGGKADLLRSAVDWSTAPVPVLFDDDGCYIAEAGGRHLLTSTDDGLVLDLGQSAIKIMVAGCRARYERDFDALPVAPGPVHWSAQQRLLKNFMARAVTTSCKAYRYDAPPEEFVIALPCKISPDGTPDGSSYGGLKGNQQFIPSLLSEICPDQCNALLVNDAELAAYSVMKKRPELAGKLSLVLTVGFGVGAALINQKIHGEI